MRRVVFTLILAAVAALGTMSAMSARLSAQKDGQLFLSLTTPDGKPIEGLKAEEVAIQEDGVACKTLKVEPIAWPSKLQVLVDNARSNTTPINPLQNGLKEFFALIPDGVEMSMYTTSPTPRPIVKPTTDRQKLIDAIGLIAPDSGTGMFFDALLEASERVAKDKTPGYYTLVMIGSDFGAMRALDRDFQKLQTNVFNYGITTHVLLHMGGQGGNTGGGQVDLGLNITKFSGGRYENFNAATRLATLLPDVGKTVAQTVTMQKLQYRVTYQRPANSKGVGASVGAQVARAGDVRLSLHGDVHP